MPGYPRVHFFEIQMDETEPKFKRVPSSLLGLKRLHAPLTHHRQWCVLYGLACTLCVREKGGAR